MRTDAVVYILAVGALMLGVFGVFMSGELFNADHVDVRDMECHYDVIGTVGEDRYTGTAVRSPITENGSFHNCNIGITAFGPDGKTYDHVFTVIFGPDDLPQVYSYGKDIEWDGQVLPLYTYSSNGYVYSIAAGEKCHIPFFEIGSDDLRLSGTVRSE
ncbi:MAG: hypothetical protein MJZ68_01305 [archaeon]|nr:hypothetical protein [archaeon]